MREIKLVIPEDIDKKYNSALFELKKGENTMIGNRDKLKMLKVGIEKIELCNVMILGEQGVGKTALVEQMLYEEGQTSKPMIAVSLAIEILGELQENVMISRMRTILDDMKVIYEATAKGNDISKKNFSMALFIDEVHKLNRYGFSNGSSGAMNALKESTARSVFPLITATTDYEFRKLIAEDLAFERRFTKIIMDEPDKEEVVQILRRRLERWEEAGEYVPEYTDLELEELVDLTNAYIKNQADPAKSIATLSLSVAYCSYEFSKNNNRIRLDHEAFKFAFFSEGYNIDSTTTADHVYATVHSRVKGQPLALMYLKNAINSTFYTKRDRNKPLLTIINIGTTGTGKTETAKALALAFFGREDAILRVEGGDYPVKEDAIRAQNFIGDGIVVNKQQVILLDEIEKSHKAVLNGYMRMIDEGVVRDSNNIERSLNNTIVVATSNLGAKTFNDLAVSMGINKQENPDELTDEIIMEWYKKESSVRKALQAGDEGMNNGIRPEFLERFQLTIPYLPLARKTMAQIARNILEKLYYDQKELGYIIQLPRKESRESWQEWLPNTMYENIDPVSVMIAEDVVNSEATTAGARSIIRFIETNVKTKIANAIAERIESNLSLDGVFRLSTNGSALFEENNRGVPDVKVDFIDRRDL